MDFKVCGLLDIIIVFLGLVFIVLGYKKGFIKKILSVVGFLAIAILAFVYCKQLASFLIEKEFIYPSIYNPIQERLLAASLKEGLTADSTLVDFLTVGLEIPAPISELFSKVLNVSGSIEEMCMAISQYLSNIAMNVISFVMIVVGVSILVLILKIITNVMRKVKLVRMYATTGKLIPITAKIYINFKLKALPIIAKICNKTGIITITIIGTTAPIYSSFPSVVNIST